MIVVTLPATTPPSIAITGASGLIGRALTGRLKERGFTVIRLVRGAAAAADEAAWSPAGGLLESERLAGVAAVIHLAGENIGAARWTRRRMAAIWSSRIDATRALASSLVRLTPSPAAFLCASAVGIYGDSGDEVLDEASPPGRGFLPELCQAWEAAARIDGVRVVNLRFGVVLSAAGGMLAKLLTPFRLGLGGPVGSGRQYLSWISLADAVAAVEHALANEAVRGPVNVVAPEPVTNAEFTRGLAHELHRPAFFRVPAFALRLALGRMADEAILASTRATPAALARSGFGFRFPRLAAALRAATALPRSANASASG